MSRNQKYFLYPSEYAQREEISLEAAKSRIRRGNICTIRAKAKKGYRKNHPEICIHYTQLSTKEAQERFLADHGLVPNKKNELDSEDRENFGLTPKQRARLEGNSQVVKIYLEALQGLPPGRKTAFTQQFAKAHGINTSTLYRIIDKYIKEGKIGLTPKWNCGTQRRKLEDDKEAMEFIEKTYIVEFGPTVLETHQRYCQEFKDKREKLFSLTAVADFIHRHWSESERLLAREPDKWKKQHGLWVNRDWNQVEVNEIFFSDAKQIDICCNNNGRSLFPWITAFMDARSRKFLGWVLTVSPDSWAIAQAFDYAITAYGVPKVIYIDRGKPYKSHMISGGKVKSGKVVNLFENIESEQFIGIFRELGCEVFFSYPNNPREKIIEANFGIFTDRLRNIPGYRGHSTKHRPLKLEREIKEGKILSFDELYKEINKVIEERNARPHSTTHRVPNSYYEDFVPVVPSESLRAFLKMDRHWVKIRNSGVKIREDFYRGEGLWRHSGEEVEVRRDPLDIRKAAIIQGNNLLEIAHLEPMGHYRDEITLKNRETVAKLNQKIQRERKKVLGQAELIDDPRRAAMEMGEEVKLRRREVRPGSNIISLGKREKLARETVKGLKKADEIDLERESMGKEAAIVNKQSIRDRYMAAIAKKRAREEAPKPRRRLIPRERLTMYLDDEEDE